MEVISKQNYLMILKMQSVLQLKPLLINYLKQIDKSTIPQNY